MQEYQSQYSESIGDVLGDVSFEKNKDGYKLEGSGFVAIALCGILGAYLYIRWGHSSVRGVVKRVMKRGKKKS